MQCEYNWPIRAWIVLVSTLFEPRIRCWKKWKWCCHQHLKLVTNTSCARHQYHWNWYFKPFRCQSHVDIYFSSANDLREIISKINRKSLFESFEVKIIFNKTFKSFDSIVKCFSRRFQWQIFLFNNPQSIILTNCVKCFKTVS